MAEDCYTSDDSAMGLMHAPNCPVDPSRLRYPLLVSEKLNGFRLLVVGGELLTKEGRKHANRQLWTHFAELIDLSRRGYVFDCECYSDQMELPELQSILQSADRPIPQHVKAHVFDCLTITEFFGNRAARFERRIARYIELLAGHRPANAVTVEHAAIASPDHLMARYRQTLSSGGEGLMLRKPDGGYHHGRCSIKSGLMFKLKPETCAA
jgi:ATP-dependent DNA ligase